MEETKQKESVRFWAFSFYRCWLNVEQSLSVISLFDLVLEFFEIFVNKQESFVDKTKIIFRRYFIEWTLIKSEIIELALFQLWHLC